MMSHRSPAAFNEDSHAGGGRLLWPYIETGILDEVLRHRSTIVFTNSGAGGSDGTIKWLYAARLQRSPSIAVDAAHFGVDLRRNL